MNRLRLGTVAAILAIGLFLWFRFEMQPEGSSASETTSAVAETNAAKADKNAEVATEQIQKKPANSAQSAGGTRQKGGGGARPGGRGGRPPSLVVTRLVTDALINDRLKAVGNGTAAASVSVVPLSGGLLTEIKVSSGQRVEANAVLATLDNEEQIIARDRAARTATDAATDAKRLADLFRSRTSTEVELNRANAILADAELALREAELTLSRRTITAPIAGIVGLVSIDVGNYVTVQTELVTIDDRSIIVLEFWIPERFANQIALGQGVNAIALAIPGNELKGVISGISSRIESDSRTLKVQAQIDNADDSLRPGMSFEVSMNFEGQRFPAVNPLAVQWDSSGSYIWKVVDSKVSRVPVRIIQRNPESVLVEAELVIGDSVVTEGVLSVRQGATVRVEGAARKPASANAGGNIQRKKPEAGKPDSPKPVSDAAGTSTKKASDADSVTGKQQGS
jgi:RND family efflux transporter MFP subunit